MGKKLIDSKTSETHMTATRQMAFGFAGGYERAFTQREQRFYLLVDARGNRSVRYVNFEKHFTDEHGYWEFNPVSQALFIKFNHWGSSGTARRCLLNRSHTMELDLDNSCFPHVCFEGRDYLDRSICIRLGSWTSDPSKGIIKDGTVDMEYWKREPVNIQMRRSTSPTQRLSLHQRIWSLLYYSTMRYQATLSCATCGT